MVKAVEIARRLNISKATVSLALNGKPGVSRETREAVLQCKEELEQENPGYPRKGPVPQSAEKATLIKLVLFDRALSVVCDSTLNLWTDTLRRFDHEAKKFGYSIGITYASPEKENIFAVVEECNHPQVAGVLLFATEMRDHDFTYFSGLRKPMVIYDNDLGSQHHCIVADNEVITQRAVQGLAASGYRNLVYLAENFWIYNFEKRRIGYLAGLYTARLDKFKCPIIEVGETVEEAENFMQQWLAENPLPDAFLTENYRVSIGLIRALHTLGIEIPEQVGILGIDEIPAYMTEGIQLSCIRIDHRDRVPIAMKLLIQEIEEKPDGVKLNIVSRSQIIKGESLR